MSDTIGDVASKSGLSIEQAETGMGALLSAMKGSLPAENFSRLQAAVPNADQMMTRAEQSGGESSGGLLSALAGRVGKLFGGGESAVPAKLTQVGFSPEQLQQFLPQAVEFLRNKVPADVMERVSSLIPGAVAAGRKDS
jgi:hypothetical protein